MQMILVWVIRLVFIFLFLKWTFADACCKGQFRKKKYIPDFAKKVGSTDLKVVYAGGNTECGDTVNILQALTPPTLYFDLQRQCKFATVVSFGPDSLVVPPYLLWIVTNIPPNNLRKGFTTPEGFKNKKKNGCIISDYTAPKDPTGGIGVRRTIVDFVYCQRSYNSDKKRITELLRGPFNVTDYAKQHNLGDPVAGQFHFFAATGITLPPLVALPESPIL